MNLENLKDIKLIHRNMLHFYTLTTKDKIEKLKKKNNATYHHIKKNKTLKKGLT